MNIIESDDAFAARMGEFTKNRAAFPEDELMKYAGQWVAWSPDGTAIVASSTESDIAVYEMLKAKGYDIGKYHLSFVDYADIGELGGALLFVDDSDGVDEEPEN